MPGTFWTMKIRLGEYEVAALDGTVKTARLKRQDLKKTEDCEEVGNRDMWGEIIPYGRKAKVPGMAV